VLPFQPAGCATLFHKKTKFSNAFALEEEMHTSAVSGNTWSKVVFGLTAALLAFAPPTARPGEVAEATPGRNPLDLQICSGYFALCAASTCTPTGKTIAVNTVTGGTRNFPEADCTCPVILGQSLADLAGGNMQGSCDPPGPGQLWSEYQIRPDIPQAITNWVPHLPEDFAPAQVCPASLNLGNQYAQCYSMACDDETYINNVPVVTCHCALGATLFGTPAKSNSSFTILAGQGDPRYCAKHPISNVINVSSP
jgi:hypothetical protein